MRIALVLLFAWGAAANSVVMPPSCAEVTPQSKYDLPLCADEAMNAALVESVEHGDRSALALLKRRYATSRTYDEQHLIAEVLLRHHAASREIWDELFTTASMVLRAEPDSQEWRASVSALATIAGDARARTLLLDALAKGDFMLINIATTGLAAQRDTSALEAIDAAFRALGHPASALALNLAAFQSKEADRIAFQYLVEDDYALYRDLQQEALGAAR